MKYIYLILIFISLLGCASQSEITNRSKESKGQTSKNNKIIVSDEVVDIAEESNDRIVFKGSDNNVILEYFNSFFNTKNSNDLIIIEGNGNVFKLTHNSVVDNSVNSADTITLKGDENYIEILNQYFLDNSTNSSDSDTLLFDFSIEIIEMKENASSSNSTTSSKIENKLTNEWVTIDKAFSIYSKQGIKGNTEAIFYLGEMYQMGLGTKVNMKKAKYYYEIAAEKNHIQAQALLGYIYELDYEWSPQDLSKAKYWYSKAAKQGNEFATDRLKLIE